jgi:hypothetical protein
MVVRQIMGQIRLMKKFEYAPQFIILHVAGNDLGYKKVIRWILIELPNTTIIWSEILHRLKWRYSTNQTAMHECRSILDRCHQDDFWLIQMRLL